MASRGIIVNGGDVPPELRALDAARWAGKRVLIGRGIDDPWYTDEKMAADVVVSGRPSRDAGDTTGVEGATNGRPPSAKRPADGSRRDRRSGILSAAPGIA